MWGDEPVADNTREETERLAREKFKWAMKEKSPYAIVLYNCFQVCEIDWLDMPQ